MKLSNVLSSSTKLPTFDVQVFRKICEYNNTIGISYFDIFYHVDIITHEELEFILNSLLKSKLVRKTTTRAVSDGVYAPTKN